MKKSQERIVLDFKFRSVDCKQFAKLFCVGNNLQNCSTVAKLFYRPFANNLQNCFTGKIVLQVVGNNLQNCSSYADT